jgi:hypothetical protein
VARVFKSEGITRTLFKRPFWPSFEQGNLGCSRGIIFEHARRAHSAGTALFLSRSSVRLRAEPDKLQPLASILGKSGQHGLVPVRVGSEGDDDRGDALEQRQDIPDGAAAQEGRLDDGVGPIKPACRALMSATGGVASGGVSGGVSAVTACARG